MSSPELSGGAADRAKEVDEIDDDEPKNAIEAGEEEPAATNGHAKAERSPSPRELSASPRRKDERDDDKSPADRRGDRDRSMSRERARSDSREDRRRARSDSREPRKPRDDSREPRRRRDDSREPRRRRDDSREPRRRRDDSRSPSYSRDRRYRSRSRSRDRRDRRDRSRSRDRSRRSPPRSSRYSPQRGRSPVVAPYYARPRRTPPRTGTTLFVAGLNFITTEREVEAKFGKYGTCKEARIVRNPMNGESRGFGFVAMKYEEDCDDAIKHLDGAEWNGRRLAVERARNVK